MTFVKHFISTIRNNMATLHYVSIPIWYLLRSKLRRLLIISLVLLPIITSALSFLECTRWLLSNFQCQMSFPFSTCSKIFFHITQIRSRLCSIYVFFFTFLFNAFIIKRTINFFLFTTVYGIFCNISLRPFYKLLRSYSSEIFISSDLFIDSIVYVGLFSLLFSNYILFEAVYCVFLKTRSTSSLDLEDI